jgi:hypothetical protein
VRPSCIPSETQVSFGVHPCTVLQKGHWENVTLSGSLSISARSISTWVGTNLFVLGHLNINRVTGPSSRHWQIKAGLPIRGKPATANGCSTCAHLLVRSFICLSQRLRAIANITGGLLDGQKVKAPRVDKRRNPHVEGACEKEKAGSHHRPDLEANRRRDAAKSIQYRIITRLAYLKSDSKACRGNRRLR